MFQSSTAPSTPKLTQSLLLALVIVTPMAVLPLFDNFINLSKMITLSIAALLVFSLFIVKAMKKGGVEIAASPLVTALFVFGLSMLLSIFLSSPYPVQHLVGMGGMYLALVVIGIVGGSLLPKLPIQSLVTALTSSGVIISILTLLQVMGVGPAWFINSLFNLQLPNTAIFNVTGSAFIATQFLLVVLIGMGAWLVNTKKITVFWLVTGVIIIGGFLLNGWNSLPGKPASPVLLPYTAGWSVAIDVLRYPRSALIGIGPENYNAAYTLFKPAWINTQPWWNMQFSQSSNVPLTLLTTTGLLGFMSWVFLVWMTLKTAYQHRQKVEYKILGTLLTSMVVLQVLFAPNIVLLTLFGVCLAILITLTQQKWFRFHALALSIFDPKALIPHQVVQTKVTRIVLAVIGVAIVGGISYGLTRAWAASNYVFKSVLAIQKQDAIKVYEYQAKATQLNPYQDAYRRQYALTNMQIAAALSNKTDITEAEQEQVAQLIQQAIREARAATVLNPEDSRNHQVLAQIYRNLIGVAQDADQWTVSTYAQAIQTAPTDPNLRIELGGLLYAQQQYSQAIGLFQQAVELKPDLPNGYYNAANALRELGQYEQSKLAYQKTLSLLDSNSDNYIQAAQELENVEKMIAAQPKAEEKPDAQSSNQTPSILDQNVNESQSSLLDPAAPVQVDAPAATPVVEQSTTPTASPSATANPTP